MGEKVNSRVKNGLREKKKKRAKEQRGGDKMNCLEAAPPSKYNSFSLHIRIKHLSSDSPLFTLKYPLPLQALKCLLRDPGRTMPGS